MKMLTVSEAALDSIQRMGEDDKARIAMLEVALRGAQGMLAKLTDSPACMKAVTLIDGVLRVNTDSQSIVRK